MLPIPIEHLAIARFAEDRFHNFCRNWPWVRVSRSMEDLDWCGRGWPAFVVGAGPSLDLLGPVLRRAQDRAVIVACDAAYRPLVGLGIAPDFVVSLDPQPVSRRKLWGVVDKRAALVSHPCAFVSCEGFERRVAWLGADVFGAWMAERSGEPLDQTEMTGVANLALRLAVRLGVDRIFLAGVDFCWQPDQGHATGVSIDYRPGDAEFVEGAGHLGAVRTTEGFMVQARMMGDIAGESGVEVWNLSPWGLWIDDCPPLVGWRSGMRGARAKVDFGLAARRQPYGHLKLPRYPDRDVNLTAELRLGEKILDDLERLGVMG